MTGVAEGLFASTGPISKRTNMTGISSASNLHSGSTVSSNSRSALARVGTDELWTKYQDLLARTVAAEEKSQQTGNALNGLSCFISDSTNQGALQNACSPQHWAAIQARQAQDAALEVAQKSTIVNSYNDTGIDPFAAWDRYLGKPSGSTLAGITGDLSMVVAPEVALENGVDLTVVGGTASVIVPQETAPEDASGTFASTNPRPANTVIEQRDMLGGFQSPDLVAELLAQLQTTLKIVQA
jgi:hypothetical protein